VLDRDAPPFERSPRWERVSVLFVTTALFNQLVQAVPDIFSTLRCLLFGGEAVDPRVVATVLERGRPARLLHVYGPTECTTYSTWHERLTCPRAPHRPSRPIANSTVTCARPAAAADRRRPWRQIWRDAWPRTTASPS
jgi:non-ribosomal peptide synthetase component F